MISNVKLDFVNTSCIPPNLSHYVSCTNIVSGLPKPIREDDEFYNNINDYVIVDYSKVTKYLISHPQLKHDEYLVEILKNLSSNSGKPKPPSNGTTPDSITTSPPEQAPAGLGPQSAPPKVHRQTKPAKGPQAVPSVTRPAEGRKPVPKAKKTESAHEKVPIAVGKAGESKFSSLRRIDGHGTLPAFLQDHFRGENSRLVGVVAPRSTRAPTKGVLVHRMRQRLGVCCVRRRAAYRSAAQHWRQLLPRNTHTNGLSYTSDKWDATYGVIQEHLNNLRSELKELREEFNITMDVNCYKWFDEHNTQRGTPSPDLPNEREGIPSLSPLCTLVRCGGARSAALPRGLAQYIRESDLGAKYSRTRQDFLDLKSELRSKEVHGLTDMENVKNCVQTVSLSNIAHRMSPKINRAYSKQQRERSAVDPNPVRLCEQESQFNTRAGGGRAFTPTSVCFSPLETSIAPLRCTKKRPATGPTPKAKAPKLSNGAHPPQDDDEKYILKQLQYIPPLVCCSTRYLLDASARDLNGTRWMSSESFPEDVYEKCFLQENLEKGNDDDDDADEGVKLYSDITDETVAKLIALEKSYNYCGDTLHFDIDARLTKEMLERSSRIYSYMDSNFMKDGVREIALGLNSKTPPPNTNKLRSPLASVLESLESGAESMSEEDGKLDLQSTPTVTRRVNGLQDSSKAQFVVLANSNDHCRTAMRMNDSLGPDFPECYLARPPLWHPTSAKPT